MERRDDEAPFPREPWQRLLVESQDGPPETTDARIRAAARRDLAPRGQRWWLPASLAASFVLAVMVVRSEYGTIRRPVVVESAEVGDSAIDARLIERGAGQAPREEGQSPSAAQAKAKRARETVAADAYGYQDAETGTEDAGTGPRVGGPEHELRAASELPGETASDEASRLDVPRREQALDNITVTANRRAASSESVPAAAPPAAATSGFVGATDLPVPPSPEAWYAQIRKMIAEGRRTDAERELAALRKAYPDWAAKNVKEKDLR